MTLLSTILWAGCSGTEQRAAEDEGLATSRDEVQMTDAEWRKILTPEEYEVLRRKGTERPFTGKYWNTTEVGTYVCAGCGMPLFRSDAKFESGCGWPSFFEPIGDDRIIEIEDRSHGMVRTEILCSRCKGHLGHVFPDGPEPTGLRYCLNSVSLKLDKDDEDGED